MDIMAKLRRAEQQYRHSDGFRPNRIVLKGEAAQALADKLVEDQMKYNSSDDITPIGDPTRDELFLNGGMAYFKNIPVIAELAPGKELIVE